MAGVDWTRRGLGGVGAAALFAAMTGPGKAQVAGPAGSLPPTPPLPAPAGAIGTGLDEAERMTVPVLINGKGPYPFVVDTGAERSALSAELAAELMLVPGPAMVVHGVAGAVTTSSVLADTLTVGGRQLENLTLPLLSAANIGAMGVLGIDAVRDQRVTLDFLNKRIVVSPTPVREQTFTDIVVRAKSRFGQLVLVDSYFQQHTVLVVIDTGAQNTIGNNALRARVRHESLSGPPHADIFSVTGQSTTGDWALISAVHVGGFEMSHLPVLFSDLHSFGRWRLQDQPALLLGMDVLRQFETVDIDFARREVRFHNLMTPGQRLTSTGSRFSR